MPDGSTIGYVVKRYPRFSETFIVNEILAHEAAGLAVQIFSLLPTCDTHFQDAIAQVRAPVTYLPHDNIRAADFWSLIQETAAARPRVWQELAAIEDAELRELCQAMILAREVRERGIEHLHAHFATSPTTVARLAARIEGITYSFTAHAKDIYGPDVRHADLRTKLADAAAAVTVSDYNRDYLRGEFGAAAARLARVYNGLPLDDFPFASPRERLPRIVAVGRLVEKKGFGDLIDACALLARGSQSFSCQIVGAGPLHTQLDCQISRLGLREHVHLLGPRPRAEVVEHVRHAAVFAAPCVVSSDGDRDGLPTVLLEAMALGTPAVATPVTGIPELVCDGQTGLIVGQHNPMELAAALQRLIADAALRARLADAARAHIETSFDIRRNAAALRQAFAAAVSAPVPALQEMC